MNEELVLATLTIDKDGVVRGVAEINRDLRGNQQEFERTGQAATKAAGPFDLLVKRMFSLKSAVVALLGAFTLAGVIARVIELTSSLVTNTDWWKRWTEAVQDAWGALAKGETILDAVARRLKEAEKSGGVMGFGQFKEQFETLIKARNKLVEEAGSFDRSGPAGQAAATLNENAIRALGDKMLDLAIKTGLTREQVERLFNIDLSGAVTLRQLTEFNKQMQEGFFDPFALQEWEDAIEALKQRNIALETQTPFEFPVIDIDAVDRWEEALDLQERQNIALEDANPLLQQQLDYVDALTRRYSEYAGVVGAASSAVAAAAESGILSETAATRARAVLVAAEATIRGMFELAAAAASAAWGDARGVILHKIAAGLYFATAAFNAAGAFGGHGGGGGGGVGGPPAAAAPAEPTRNITVVNEGTMIGMSADQLVRWITEMQTRAAER